MKLIVIGNTRNGDIFEALVKHKDIEVIGGIADKSSSVFYEEQINFFTRNHIPCIDFCDIKDLQPDMCLIIAYYRLIDVALLSNVLTLNIHAGVLPMWKGFHANAWAIINGEQKIGYTLHQVNECMDAGDIYHRFLEDVKPNERYAEVIPRIKRQVFEQLPQILVDVYRGKIEPISQNLQQSFFCTKIIPDDGLIKSWDIDTKTLYNLYRVVAYPYGAGLFFVYRDTTFEILEMSVCDEISYICVPGAIVNIEKGNMFVKTKDSYVRISKIRRQMDEVDIEKTFKIGNRLEKWASKSHFVFHREQ